MIAKHNIRAEGNEHVAPKFLEVVRLIFELLAPMRQDDYQIRLATFGERKIFLHAPQKNFAGGVIRRRNQGCRVKQFPAHQLFQADIVHKGGVSKDCNLHAALFDELYPRSRLVLHALIRADEWQIFSAQDVDCSVQPVKPHVEHVIVGGRDQIEARLFHCVGEFVGEIQIKPFAVAVIALGIRYRVSAEGTFKDAD